MLGRKSKDKTIKEGVVGKYVKKDTPPEIPSKLFYCYFKASIMYYDNNAIHFYIYRSNKCVDN